MFVCCIQGMNSLFTIPFFCCLIVTPNSLSVRVPNSSLMHTFLPLLSIIEMPNITCSVRQNRTKGFTWFKCALALAHSHCSLSVTVCSLVAFLQQKTGHRAFSPQDTRRSQQAMASRGGATRPNGPNAGTKICQFKLVLLGESAVGKSSLVLRFVKGQFHEFQESTIGGEGPPERPA